MPWMEGSPIVPRTQFVHDHRLDLYTMVELCAPPGISRKTGSKWRGRFEDGGWQGLQGRSRAPHDCPHRATDDI